LGEAILLNVLRGLAVLVIVVLVLLLAAGYTGALHPAGDSFAVFRPQLAALLALTVPAALALRARRWAALGAGLAGIAGLPILLAAVMPPAAGQGLRLYQKNLLYINDDLAALAADIRAADPAILTLQEVSDASHPLLASLTDFLPHQMHCPFKAVGGTAIATRLPPTPAAQICQPGLSAMQVAGPDGPLWIVSIHLHWPWPFAQAAQVDALIPVLQGLEGPVVMAGDFNMVPWSQTLHRFATASRSRLAGPVRGTWPGFGPLATLPIDHVMGPAGGTITLRPRAGSDHHGLLADL
jgi:endonuclease/exonuclease/phosphatase (EEP) superfamily protein YafD